MPDRMTALEVRETLAAGSASAPPALVEALERAGQALADYEAEAAARAGMPSLAGGGWAVLNKDGEAQFLPSHAEALAHVTMWDAIYPGEAPHRAVRLAVEVVVATEDVAPARVVGESGWAYEVHGADRVVHQLDPESGLVISLIHDTGESSIPPNDRALVARLLGEVA